MNPMQLIQMFKGGGNPQTILQNIVGNNPMMQNPMIKNAMEMAQKGDVQGVEQLARNLCKENNVNPDEMLGQLKQQLGIK